MGRTWHRQRNRPGRRAAAPLAGLRKLMNWDPFLDRDVAKVAREAEPVFSPSFDILETAAAYVFLADLPGVRREAVQVAWAPGRLTVSGTRDAEPSGEGADYFALERTFGAFSRSFHLPAGACPERASATLQDGVLTVQVPKVPAGAAGQVTLTRGSAPDRDPDLPVRGPDG
jgi:HSP20 family protein